jgi:hypothetical protein
LDYCEIKPYNKKVKPGPPSLDRLFFPAVKTYLQNATQSWKILELENKGKFNKEVMKKEAKERALNETLKLHPHISEASFKKNYKKLVEGFLIEKSKRQKYKLSPLPLQTRISKNQPK